MTLTTVSTKSSKALARLVSVAVTRTVTTPTSALPGVPENVCVAALKLSQVGSTPPLDKVAA